MIDLAALQVLKALPATLQTRILSNPAFRSDVGINGLVALFNEAGRIRLGDLLDAARRVYDTAKSHTIRNLDGEEVQIVLRDHRAVIIRDGDDARDKSSTPFELALLSPDANVRLEAFRAVSSQFGVTGPRSSFWVPILEQRSLSNREIEEIHNAIALSVPNWQENILEKIAAKTVTPADLVPSHAAYFETLCGPLPNDMPVDEYILGPLAAHRKALVAEDLFEGLALMLPGSLRADAAISLAVSDFSDEDVWNAVRRLGEITDPFSLLGLVEIALARRIPKCELSSFASALNDRLCGETLLRHDGLDIYEFFPAFVELSLRRTRQIDGMMTQPPYWHWLCAFTHAGLLTRIMHGLEFSPNEMTEWIASARSRRDGLADILALRSEPTWRFDCVTRDRIQAEIVGRLRVVAQKEEAEGRAYPGDKVLKNRIDELMSRGLSPFRPGPLEGNLRPMDRGTQQALPSEDVSKLLNKLNDAPVEFPWGGVDNASASLFIPESLRNAMTEKLPNVEFRERTFKGRSNLLITAALIAAVHKDRDMAEAIAGRLFKEFAGEDDTQSAFLVLFFVSTAVDADEWIDWLREKLQRLAFVAPAGPPLRKLGAVIKELKALLPISQWRFGPVEAICNVL